MMPRSIIRHCKGFSLDVLRLFFVIIFLLGGYVSLKNIETLYFPASGLSEITKVEQIADGATIYGNSTKLRPECSFRAINWYMGTRFGPDQPITVEFTRVILRESGYFEFGPWYVKEIANRPIYEFEIRESTYADAIHKCVLFNLNIPFTNEVVTIYQPWDTISRFWN